MAPERIDPAALKGDVDVVNDLLSSRALLLEHAPKLSDELLRALQFSHVLRGNLTLYGWLWFVACHERRHTAQMLELTGTAADK